VGISALKGENIQQLILTIEDVLSQGSVDVDIVLPAIAWTWSIWPWSGTGA